MSDRADRDTPPASSTPPGIGGDDGDRKFAREALRRHHRMIGLHAVVQCWVDGGDGVAIDGDTARRLLRVEHVKDARLAMLREDVADYFPYSEQIRRGSTFDSLYLARLPLNKTLPRGPGVDIEKRIEMMRLVDGPRLIPLRLWRAEERGQGMLDRYWLEPFVADPAHFDQRVLASYLGLLAQGLISPRDIPPRSGGTPNG